ncbi:DNA polymerase III subunit gamma and tau [Arthrobacter sp. H41]|uniref:DNA polymerase III subunit gamma and tau n=1 Tax=Arthrobacter sp. H41 TaxID=1312978 RepID=UPI00047BA600|nr:DNA polymerase III subunit gamma and tau [Arthrobacter sp. H41]
MSTALYRRYRPETFADVIGQEHVTDPLMVAIDKNRVNHAYLFSGPRGCGKTTSARILARCLNCASGPTSTPCGVCDSCVELARNGSGSLDVIEIDAASHGGVDDARDLRERATFAPVRDRYKIFIIDEAHMVTSAGFNALLKIVEEPPEHILFIFATTEPDKVIGTIRSRTHHYPFRLVPPEPLMAYLEVLCRQENVAVAPGVLSLVVRAGGGSVRDSLSVLDQLMAGAGETGLDYELAVSLLGYTHATLLDDVVDAVAAGDAGTVFNAVDRVIQTGHDPRRFVEDLLERFRDLIVINAVPEGAASILRGIPDDQLNRMRAQANQLGGGELSRSADVTNTALTEMTGATSPRLHLELLCARLLLPAADQSVRGTLARVDRIERRLEYANGGIPQHGGAGEAGTDSGTALPTPAPASAGSRSDVPHDPTPRARTADTAGSDEVQVRGNEQPGAAPDTSSSPPPNRTSDPAQVSARTPPTAAAHDSESAPAQGAGSARVHSAPVHSAPASGVGGAGQIEMVRRAWPEIMDELAKIKRITWLNVNVAAKPRSLEGNVLVLAFTTPGNAIAFQRGPHADNLKQAIHKVLGLACEIEALHDGAAAGEARPKVPAARPTPSRDVGKTVPTPDTGAERPADVLTTAVTTSGAEPGSGPGESTGTPIDAGTGQSEGTVSSARPGSAPSAGRGTGAEPGSASGADSSARANSEPGPDSNARPNSEPGRGAVSEPDSDITAERRTRAHTDSSRETTAGWSPRDSDDSWAMVEPPEDSYDPGPGWQGTSVAGGSRPKEGEAEAPATSSNPSRPEARAESGSSRSDEQDTGPATFAQRPDPAGQQRTGPAEQQRTGPPDPVRPRTTGTTGTTGTTHKTPEATPAALTAPASASSSPTDSDVLTNGARTADAVPDAGNKPVSRYQRLLDEAERKRVESAAANNSAVDLRYVEDVPSADDETLEESGLVGRTAIERILNGRLVEERSVEPQ